MAADQRGRRDIALTTLIDLLVQIVFVFAIVLISTEAILGNPAERGYVAPEEWKTLVSIFDIDPKKAVTQQVQVIVGTYRSAVQDRDALTKDRDAVKKDRDALRKKLDEQDKRISELEKKTGAPGFPPCRSVDGSEINVMKAFIDSHGAVRVSLLPAAKAEGLVAGEDSLGRALSKAEFASVFSNWQTRGMNRVPQCRYTASVEYDPKALAGDYQPAISAMSSLFRLTSIKRSGS